jgi:hypothetical protein
MLSPTKEDNNIEDNNTKENNNIKINNTEEKNNNKEGTNIEVDCFH